MLTNQTGNSDTPSPQLLVDFQWLRLGFAGGNEWSRVIQEDCLQMLEAPVQESKKSHLPSKFSLFGTWLLLILSIGAMLTPISNVWSQEPYPNEMRTEDRALTLPE
ncbi:hypothetical protein NG796_22135 [Laspinema sp. A4]|uniref:hypothetical protein n=1 Tax=Laspinema sp. D2d TaxID=2953686 RepID=UPI0021BB4000|nr:hypothetical protein [Laspinema sp. D2d]MCT7985982.1 hypothetical protein [Laspinema sp. D2d]